MKPKYNNNSRLTPNAQSLRKNMTEQERKLWYMLLKELPVRFRRQHVIGNYIVDFYCSEKNIAIEIDGSQHYMEKGAIKDEVRTEFLNACGVRVLRYSNADINERFSEVCEDIYNKVIIDKDWKHILFLTSIVFYLLRCFNCFNRFIFDLYRLDFHFIPSIHFHQRGKQEKLAFAAIFNLNSLVCFHFLIFL